MKGFEIEKMLRLDNMQKKRIGRGAYYKKASVRGSKVHKLNTASAYMTPAQIKKLNGEVRVVVNMNELMSYDDFVKLEKDIQRQTFNFWRENKKYSVAKIKKAFNVSNKQYYDLLDSLGIKTSSLEAFEYRHKEKLDTEKLIEIKESAEIDYEYFLKLNREQQAFLIFSWRKMFGSDYLMCFKNRRDNASTYISSNTVYRIKKKHGDMYEAIILNMFEPDIKLQKEIDEYEKSKTLKVVEDKVIEIDSNSVEDVISEEEIRNEITNNDFEVATAQKEVAITIEETTENKQIVEDHVIEDVEKENIINNNDNNNEEIIDVLNLEGVFTKEILLMILNQLDSNKKYNLQLSIEQTN